MKCLFPPTLDNNYVFYREDEKTRAKSAIDNVFSQNEASTGLVLKTEKTWSASPRDFRRDGIKLLGSNIGGGSDDYLFSQAENFSKIFGKLKTLNAQDCFLLLRLCAIPKITHLLRTMIAEKTVWERFDSSIREVILFYLRRLDINILDDNLLSLPMRKGGLGFTLPSKIFQACHLASESESFKMLGPM